MNIGVFFGLAGGLFTQFLAPREQADALLAWALGEGGPDSKRFAFLALDGTHQTMVLHREHVVFAHTFAPQPQPAPQPSALKVY